MQIFTVDMFVQAYVESRGLIQELFTELLSAAWQSVAGFPVMMLVAIDDGNWSSIVAAGLMLIAGIVLLYRLIRRNPLRVVRSIFND